MYGIIITPTWNPSTYHPHARRINQWIDVFKRNKLYPIIFSLNGNSSHLHIKKESFDLILGEHPIFKNGIQIKPQKISDIKIIVERIKGLVQKNSDLVKKAKLILVCHPMLLTCIHENECRKIIDFPDAPQSEAEIKRWGFVSKNDFFSLLINYEITLLHTNEEYYLKSQGINNNKIYIVSPTISSYNPPSLKTAPTNICIHGRGSSQALKLFFNLFNTIKTDSFFSGNGLTTTVCGELSNLIPKNLPVKNKGRIKNLKKQLHNSLCPVISKDVPTGISTRVLDIVESGGYLVASTKSAIGYPMKDFPYLFNDINSLPITMKKVIDDIDKASWEMEHLQKRFINMSYDSNKILDSLVLS